MNIRSRHEPQYALIDPDLVEVAVLPKNPQWTPTCFVQLREISTGSATVLFSGQPAFHHECEIWLASARFEGPILISAEMLWARPDSAGDWLLGYGIDPPLSDELFKRLLVSGLLRRRCALREPARILAEVQWQPGQPRLPALVRDLSKGGFCLATDQAPEGTQNACIFAATRESEVLIPLKVRWSTHVGSGYFVGCQFIRSTDYVALRRLQPIARDHFRKAAKNTTFTSFDAVGI